MKTWIWVVISVVIVLVVSVVGYVYLSMASSGYEKQDIENPLSGVKFSNDGSGTPFVASENDVSYIVNELGAYQLHNPPMSGDMPRIQVVIDGESFISEISSGAITTTKTSNGNVDLKITTSNQEVLKMLLGNVTDVVKSSVNLGSTRVEIIASYVSLFSKGYLNIYKALTGKSLSASVIKGLSG